MKMRRVPPKRKPQEFAPPLSRYGHRLVKTQSMHRCAGCGRVLPVGSFVQTWSIWGKSRRIRHRCWICSQCEDVIYGCDGHAHMTYEEPMVRTLCGRCAAYPTCERIEWLKDSKPEDVWFGDLERDDIPECRRGEWRNSGD